MTDLGKQMNPVHSTKQHITLRTVEKELPCKGEKGVL